MKQKAAILISIIFAFLFLLSCGDQKKESSEDDQWFQIILQHTSGVISKKSNIRILFANDVVDEESVDKLEKGVLTFSPAIDGKAYWKNRNELVFYPDSKLVSETSYRAILDLDGVITLPEGVSEYSFDFIVKKQFFEINIEGLTSVSTSGLSDQKLTGTLETSDVEDGYNIEKIIKAYQENSDLNIKWFHNSDGVTHKFTVENIKRKSSNSSVDLKWDGLSIGVKKSGSRKVTVTPKGSFSIIGVDVVSGKQNYILIRFSDPLDPGQNLNGLIRTNKSRLKFKIEGNIVKAFPDSAKEGSYEVIIHRGIKNISGDRLKENSKHVLIFTNLKPGARFVGKGVILPENKHLTIPFEAVNLNSVQITAFEVYSKNIGRFLQVNKFEGNSELKRVGRFLWRKTVPLNPTPTELSKWSRYALDVSKLFKDHPGSLFRITLSYNRGNSAYPCSEVSEAVPVVKEPDFKNDEDLLVKDTSSWDNSEDPSYSADWEYRENPCHNAYYRKEFNSKVVSSRNLLASNIGITVKHGSDGHIHAITTDLRTAAIMKSVEVRVYNFQDKLLGKSKTDKNGFADIYLKTNTPFYLVAKKGVQKGYIKLNNGSALPVSHFDVSGEKIKQGLKGQIYCERGVFRPGDNIYLTFVLEDKKKTLPPNHPVSLELYNPSGQLVLSAVPSKSVDNFYSFYLITTSSNHPTHTHAL